MCCGSCWDSRQSSFQVRPFVGRGRGNVSTIHTPSVSRAPQRLLLYAVDWRTYTRLLRALDGRHLRLTYERGTLEFMTLTHEHESGARFLGRLAVTLTEELGLPVKAGGSTTFRRRIKKRGLEPDDCFWI